MNLTLLLPLAVLAGAVPTAGPVDYQRQIQPILAKHCVGCHGPDKQRGSLRIDSLAALTEGGNRGPAIAPGKATESVLLHAITGTNDVAIMPPKEPRLSADEIALVRTWIDQGAKGPATTTVQTPRSSDHWAFQPIRRPPLPEIAESTAPVRNGIDAFIVARLRDEGLALSPEAPTTTLLRRVSLDLIGLPPTPKEIADFEAASRRDAGAAYRAAVERLLASPHYGERWGRWWLDQARYADSNGYSVDGPRTMWPYRDWVVNALNRDLPFDRFTIEQLAGDLLPNATLDQKIATGFHRNTQINQEGGIDVEQFRVESVIDRVNTTGAVWLGLTVGCCQCHDHKYDPISQRDYYQLFAFFNGQDEPALDLPLPAGMPKPNPKFKLTTLVLRERPAPRPTHILLGGDFTRPGASVSPKTPAVLPALEAKKPSRLDLARWLADSKNPLTARVIVNRVWQVYFGLGLVETENDFGTQGAKPSHPELLDWLADEFRQRGWSLKDLHRLIVTSAVYRQSSKTRPELATVDPRNRLLARQNRLRLEAELIRDVGLASSGLLSQELGGPTVFPPQPPGVGAFTQVSRPWKTSAGPDRYRRGIYTEFRRASPYPSLTVFDAPEANVTCTRRNRSNTPLQALTLLNDEAFVEIARGLAARIQREAEGDDDRIAYGFRLCLAREPKASEQAVLRRVLKQRRTAVGGSESAAWLSVARVLLNLDEFITRE